MAHPHFPCHLIALSVSVALLGCGGAATTTPQTAASASAAASKPPAVFELAAEMQDRPEEPGVASRITRVTVYSDRALVTREATVELSDAPTVHRFTRLPGWVDEGSIRAATSAGKIVDVAVERRFLARSSDAGFREVEEKHRALLRKAQALEDELAILEAQQEHVESIQVFSLEKLSTDAVTRDIKVESYGEVVEFISGSLRKTAAARREAQARREKLLPEVEASTRKLEELRRLTKLEETTVAVTVAGAAGKAKLTLKYATPGATWEPLHELRASSTTPDAVELNSFAVVTQATGEDWNNAELSFSTQSVSDTEQIPELEMLALGKTHERTHKSTRHVASSFSRAQQKYAEQNEHWNLMNQAPSQRQAELERFQSLYAENLQYFERVQSKTVEIFQGLQQRGTTAHFVAKKPAIVRSDGRSVRIPIGRDRIAAERQIIAAPERSLNAAVTLQMTNDGSQPLLPGRVARYRDGAFLGMTDVDFVAQGERFSLFFSVADQIKLTRKLDRKQSSLVRKARHRMQLSFVSTAKNLSSQPVTMVIAERVPVSENTDIRVSRVRITPRETPDAEGIARWTVTLKPGEERQFRISYQVDYPSSLVLDVKRKRDSRPKAPSPSRAPVDFEERIPDFEQML